jgi:hypothetical protein
VPTLGRLRGLGSFLLIAGAVFVALRVLHVATPLFFPSTRPGPLAVASLDEARRRAGFTPLVPAYHPASLGERPVTLTVMLQPEPRVIIVWQGEQHLSLDQRRGGRAPDHPPAGRPLAGVPESIWWMEGQRHRLILRRGDLWVDVVTDLPSRDLKRLADTLRPY